VAKSAASQQQVSIHETVSKPSLQVQPQHLKLFILILTNLQYYPNAYREHGSAMIHDYGRASSHSQGVSTAN
jgi:hypothetical protein